LVGASGRRSQNFGGLKSKVKFDFSTVRTRVIPILKRVEVSDCPSKIGRVYGWRKVIENHSKVGGLMFRFRFRFSEFL